MSKFHCTTCGHTGEKSCDGYCPRLDCTCRCEVIERTLTAVAPPVSGWRDMSSAPKRRKVIVSWVNALGKRRTTFACYFDAGELDMDDSCGDDAVDWDGKNANSGWFEEREAGDDPGYYLLSEPLTHWREIPDPPVDEPEPETRT